MFLFEVIDSLDKTGVKYALVGGYALALHGIVRATMDIDIVIKMNKSQVKLAVETLNKLGLTSRIPINSDELVEFRQEYIDQRNLIAWSFVDYKNPSKVVDILIIETLDDILIQTISVSGRKIKVAKLSEIKRMKQSSKRTKDLQDLALIKAKENEKD